MDEKTKTEQEKKLLEKLEKLSFEEALQKLEEIVDGMESGNAPLEKMISSFEEGSLLASVCQAKLDSLQKKIEILRRDRQSGNLKWAPLSGPKQEEAPSPGKDFSGGEKDEDTPF